MRRHTQMIVVTQGKPRVNSAFVIAKGKGVAAVEINMDSKNCNLLDYNDEEIGAEIWFAANENSCLLADTSEEFTYIRLPEFDGWDAFTGECGRYTARICMVKR